MEYFVEFDIVAEGYVVNCWRSELKMLKAAAIKRIQDALLSSGKFDDDDFVITHETASDEEDYEYTSLRLKYVYDERYYITADLYRGGRVFAEIAPGTDHSRESVSHNSMKDFILGITYWTELLLEELAAAPLLRIVMLNSERIDDLEEMFSALPSDYFTRAEAEELVSRLSQVEFDLNKRLSEEISDKNKLQDELVTIQNEVEKLKSQLIMLNKKNWFKAFISRMYKWVERNPETLAQLANITSQMLPEEVRKAVPTEEISTLLLSASRLSKHDKAGKEIAVTEIAQGEK